MSELQIQTESLPAAGQEETKLTAVSLDGLLLNSKAMNTLFKMSQMYASSKMVPETYQGNVNNCMVAMELAARMGISPSLVMQNLYIVQGRPSWAGSFCKALVDGCGRFASSRFVMVGQPGTSTWGCFLEAVSKRTGETVRGSTITMQLAQDEGWLDKKGSKWKTMPEQMLKYRAASFFARTECPEALMGFQTADEVQDVHGVEAPHSKTTVMLEN